MTKTMVAVLAFVMLSNAQAQTVQPQQTPNQGGDVVIQGAAPGAEARAGAQGGQVPQPTGSPIYILNNQNQRFNGQVDNAASSGSAAKQASGQSQIQEQPTTIVQDTPLKSGAAEKIRNKRVESEATTEDGIVQALEKARLNDELKRRDRFNNALDNEQPAQNAAPVVIAPAPPVQQAPPIVVQPPAAPPQPVIQVIQVPVQERPRPVQDEEDSRPARKPVVREEREPIPEPIVRHEEERRDSFYVSGLLGMGKYPDVINVQGNATGGVAIGAVRDRFVGELSFLYGSYQLQDLFQAYNQYNGVGYRVVDMTQYNLAAAAKYNILTGRLRPQVGVLGSYTRRSYSDDISGTSSGSFLTSNAIDLGALIGLEFAITEQFTIGIEFRYSTNVWSNQNGNYPNNYVYNQNQNSVEKLDYYTTLGSVKYTF